MLEIYYGKWGIADYSHSPIGYSMNLDGKKVKRERKYDCKDFYYVKYEKSNKNGYHVERENAHTVPALVGYKSVYDQYLYFPDGSKTYLCERESW